MLSMVEIMQKSCSIVKWFIFVLYTLTLFQFISNYIFLELFTYWFGWSVLMAGWYVSGMRLYILYQNLAQYFSFFVLPREYKVGLQVDSVKLKCNTRALVINTMTCKPSHCSSFFVCLFYIHYNTVTLPMLWCFMELLLWTCYIFFHNSLNVISPIFLIVYQILFNTSLIRDIFHYFYLFHTVLWIFYLKT